MADMYVKGVAKRVLASAEPMKVGELFKQLAVPANLQTTVLERIHADPLLVQTPRGEMTHAWRQGLKTFRADAREAINLKAWLLAHPQVLPVEFKRHVLANIKLAHFRDGVVRLCTPLNAIDKATLFRAICTRNIKGVRRVVAAAEYATAYRDIYALLQAGSIQGSYTQLWQTAK